MAEHGPLGKEISTMVKENERKEQELTNEEVNVYGGCQDPHYFCVIDCFLAFPFISKVD